ncbi:SDR family oxidoreductase [Streptomyces sp. NPDC001982]|uniref:SDR family NAD(P)-dependent oxidoreductase n=1 Tax=Streptomyces sp. NPDC001982 TaxID=3154405 RepID=UPI00332BAD97
MTSTLPGTQTETDARSGVLDRFRLDDKVVILTGASAGLGVAFARALAEAGADLVIGSRREDKLADTARMIHALGRTAVPVRCDVRKPEDCAALIDAAMSEFGKVDVLVNNAGVGAAIAATREEPEHFKWLIETNLEAPYWCAQSFARVAQPGSSIINVSSTLGLRPVRMPQAGYVASKTGLLGLTRDLAVQWTARKGIRVNALAPGYFPSDMSDKMGPRERALVDDGTLFGRFGRIEELTPALIFLASDASSYITGTTIAVDGGLSLH